MKIQFIIRLYRQDGCNSLIDFAILAKNVEFSGFRDFLFGDHNPFYQKRVENGRFSISHGKHRGHTEFNLLCFSVSSVAKNTALALRETT